MNKKLDHLIGQRAAEKVGKGWALTTFLREAWFIKRRDAGERDLGSVGFLVSENVIKYIPPYLVWVPIHVF
jgi:hypothetical protein